MKSERYMVTAVPIGGGERVTGFLSQEFNPFKNEFYMAIAEPQEDNPDRESGWFVSRRKLTIDPDTIEPIRLAPLYAGSRGYKCPNCDAYFIYAEIVEGEWRFTTPFCGNCGQALDWESAGKDGTR